MFLDIGVQSQEARIKNLEARIKSQGKKCFFDLSNLVVGFCLLCPFDFLNLGSCLLIP